MAISDELTRLSAVRDALVISVNNKGGELAEEATLWQIKEGVDNLPEGTDAEVVTQPAPTVTINSSTGVVTAKYTPVAGLVEDTEVKSQALELTVQGAQTITPGTADQTIAAGKYLTGVQTIKGDANLTPGYIKSGVSIFGVTGSYSGGTITLPETTATAKTMLDGYTAVVKDTTASAGYKVITGGLTPASTLEIISEVEFEASNTVDPSYSFDDYTVTGKGVELNPVQTKAICTGRAEFHPGNGDVLVLSPTVPGYFEYNGASTKTIEGPGFLDFFCTPVPEEDGADEWVGGRIFIEGPLLVGGIGVVLEGELNFKAENIKKGVPMWGVVGTYEGSGGSADPTVPDSCIAYLGSNGCIYIREESGITVTGLDRNAAEDREGFEAYGPFAVMGPLPGSVASQDGVYLDWEGFADLSRNWQIHSMVYPGVRDTGDTVYVAWGFDTVDGGYESTDQGYGISISGFLVATFDRVHASASSKVYFWPGDLWREVASQHIASYRCYWNGKGDTADSKMYFWGDHYRPTSTSGQQALFEPPWYDEDMGGYMGDAYKYSLGTRLYIGKPAQISTGYTTESGAYLAGFALEADFADIDVADTSLWYNHLLDKSKYNNL